MTHRALVLGASGGIGSALADRLEADGAVVTRRSRADGLDYDDPARADGTLAALAGPFQTIIVATGALEPDGHAPEKALKQLDPEALARQFAVNTIGPALALKHAPRLLPRGERAVVAALSARVGSIGDNRLGGWHGYRAAKAALNQLVHGAAIELARTHPDAVCVALHPGTVATRLTERHAKAHDRTPAGTAAGNLLAVIAGLTPADTGLFFDWKGARVPW